MRYRGVLEIVNVIALLGMGLWYFSIHRTKLPSISFACAYPEVKRTFPEKSYQLQGGFEMRRNPFFYPVQEVDVKMVEVDENTKQVARQAGQSLVYKGMMVWGEEKVAIFYVRQEKKTKFVKLGEFVKGYKVLDITEDEVVLSKEGGLSIITLKIGGLRD